MSRFATLKIAQIKPLLTAIGSKTGGTKPQLIAQLERDVHASKLALHQRVTTRILSVDKELGIYCV
jgi:hypothetical protein